MPIMKGPCTQNNKNDKNKKIIKFFSITSGVHFCTRVKIFSIFHALFQVKKIQLKRVVQSTYWDLDVRKSTGPTVCNYSDSIKIIRNQFV